MCDTPNSYVLHDIPKVPAGLPPMARVGMLLTTPDALDRVTYLGHGPVENYVDRRAGDTATHSNTLQHTVMHYRTLQTRDRSMYA
jgi:hypothetical protein